MEDRTVATILEKYMALEPLLDERAWRIWAALLAALLATLLPDPVSAKARREELRRMVGRVVEKTDRDGVRVVRLAGDGLGFHN